MIYLKKSLSLANGAYVYSVLHVKDTLDWKLQGSCKQKDG